MLVSLRPVSGVLNPFAAVGGASDDRSPIPSCQSCQIDDRPLAAIAWLSSSVSTGRRNPIFVALLLAFPAHVNDPRIWRGQPSNLIHGLTIAEFATTCGTLHALPIGKWLETEHFLIGNPGNSKQSQGLLTPQSRTGGLPTGLAGHSGSNPPRGPRGKGRAGITRVRASCAVPPTPFPCTRPPPR